MRLQITSSPRPQLRTEAKPLQFGTALGGLPEDLLSGDLLW